MEKRQKKRKGEKFKAQKKVGNRAIEESELKSLRDGINKFDSSRVQSFTDFPLSAKTLKGLKDSDYLIPTEIQKEAIGLALQGNDILGAAKTGSGKTLAFLIPIIERLHHLKWSAMDGLGVLIISPTRELAYQIFEVIRKVGRHHDFSVGLVIGGKNIREEATRINNTNIVICTPGRLLQHLDETAFFVADNLQVLVLDEADRILDLGFARTMNAIIENLPTERQTLLYSATQTKSVKDLARLSLKDPVYVSVHEKASNSTPTQLQQSYVVCELHEKISFLWSFIKQHPRTKVLIFIASCKQVRFLHHVLPKFRPGIAISALHGGMKQMRRMEVYQEFCRKQHIVLLATDIAARGLDFPAVNWVVQMDCPDSTNTYIHRAGRTARYERDGESILVLLPSEIKMADKLKEQKIPLEKIHVNPKKLWSLDKKLEYLCASELQMKHFAQAAFMSYLKNTYFQQDKEVFDLKQLDYEKFSFSLGLAITPRVRFLEKQQKLMAERRRNKKDDVDEDKAILKKGKKARAVTNSDDENDDKSEEEEEEEEEKPSPAEGKEAFKVKDESLEQSLGDLFSVKTIEGVVKPDEEAEKERKKEEILKQKKTLSQEAFARKLLRKKIQVNKIQTFDEDGEEEIDPHKNVSSHAGDKDKAGLDLEEAQTRLREEDVHDKKLFIEKVKKKHREKKLKERAKRQRPEADNVDDDEGVELVGAQEAQLPDLDRFYQSNSEEEDGDDDDDDDSDQEEGDDSYDDEDDEEDEEDIPSKRRKLLADDEELALKLLGN